MCVNDRVETREHSPPLSANPPSLSPPSPPSPLSLSPPSLPSLSKKSPQHLTLPTHSSSSLLSISLHSSLLIGQSHTKKLMTLYFTLGSSFSGNPHLFLCFYSVCFFFFFFFYLILCKDIETWRTALRHFRFDYCSVNHII